MKCIHARFFIFFAASVSGQFPFTEIADRFEDFLLTVHHKRPVLHYRFTQRFTGN
jgi:hypothetical protein